MRNLIIILFMFGAGVCFGQMEITTKTESAMVTIYNDDPEWLTDQKIAYAHYLLYCEEEVNDTITQHGEATIKVYPVYNPQGELIKYMYGSRRDTTWNAVDVHEYLLDHDRWDNLNIGSNIIWGGYGTTTLGFNTSGNVTYGPAKEIIEDQVTIQVERPYYYTLKREKPSQQGFYNYIYKQIILIK